MRKFGFVIGLSNTRAFEVNNGIILSKPGNEFVSFLVHSLTESYT